MKAPSISGSFRADGGSAPPTGAVTPFPLSGTRGDSEDFGQALLGGKPAPAVSRLELAHVAPSVDEMSHPERLGSADLARTAKGVLQAVEEGRPATELSDATSNLFPQLQGSKLAPADAADISATLGRARDTLLSSPAYAQGQIIPVAQSEAEGQLARSQDLVDLAMRH